MKNLYLLLAVLLLAVACGPATPSAQITDTGLQFRVVEEGTGPSPQPGDIVEVHYTGRLEDGTVFDTSEGRGPFTFPLGQGRVIAGWDEGIALMNVGGKAELTIPPELGYGAAGFGDSIPPDSTLIFDVELIGIQEAPTPIPSPTPPPTPTAAPDEITTDSGLRYIILEEGDGAIPVEGDVVQFHYAGFYLDGTEFDNSETAGTPVAFPLGSGPIAGWDEALAEVPVGTKVRVILPPELGFGAQGAGPIPPNTTVIFELTLLDILPPPPEAPQTVAEEDFEVTESGLKIFDFEVGDGDVPETGTTVQLQYSVWLEDGTRLASSFENGQPLDFIVGGGQTFPGWEEGVEGMRYGGSRQIVIPPDLAFGETGAGNGVIPPNAVLIIEMEMLPNDQ